MRRPGSSIVSGAALFVAGCHSPRVEASVATHPEPSLPLKEKARRLRLHYPLRYVFLRALKGERTLELWAADAPGPMSLVRQYPIAAASGGPGPKRRAGDLQVPEGVYRIDRFNPHSRFHLSMGLDYPNASDRIRGDRAHLGADIFIHGNRVSVGCMAMTDALIDEIYPVCASARNRKAIMVHVFPCRMNGAALAALIAEHPEHAAFWNELRPIYDAFETDHEVPKVKIARTGVYRLAV